MNALHEYLKTRLSAVDQLVLDTLICNKDEQLEALNNAMDIKGEDSRWQYLSNWDFDYANVQQALFYTCFASQLEQRDMRVTFIDDEGEEITALGIEAPSKAMTRLSVIKMLKLVMHDYWALINLDFPTRKVHIVEIDLEHTESQEAYSTGQLSASKVWGYITTGKVEDAE